MFREVGMGCFKKFCMSESVLKVCWQSWVGCFVVFCCFLCVLCVCFVFDFFGGFCGCFFSKDREHQIYQSSGIGYQIFDFVHSLF